jgi:NADH pyrophosphatase NudC (nudix superfamily)
MSLSVHEKYYKFCPSCKVKLERKLIDGRERFFCPNCDFVFWNNPKPVVSILLHDNGRILMIQRANEPLKDYWCLPGGYVNYDEKLEEAIRREEIGRAHV